MGLFSSTKKIYPLKLKNGSSMNITTDSALPDLFIFEEFIDIDEKQFQPTVFDWHPDLLQNMTSQMHMQDYISIAQGVSETYLRIAPIKISNKKLKITENEGIGVLSNDALTYFWETRNRFNVLMIPHVGTLSIRQDDFFRFSSLNEGVVCRRSPAPELLENEEWTFSPSLSNYANKNRDSLSLYFTLQILQDRDMSE